MSPTFLDDTLTMARLNGANILISSLCKFLIAPTYLCWSRDLAVLLFESWYPHWHFALVIYPTTEVPLSTFRHRRYALGSCQRLPVPRILTAGMKLTGRKRHSTSGQTRTAWLLVVTTSPKESMSQDANQYGSSVSTTLFAPSPPLRPTHSLN